MPSEGVCSRAILPPMKSTTARIQRRGGSHVQVGQHLIQAASDIFLGWTHAEGGRHFYLRQLRDMKIKPLVELF